MSKIGDLLFGQLGLALKYLESEPGRVSTRFQLHSGLHKDAHFRLFHVGQSENILIRIGFRKRMAIYAIEDDLYCSEGTIFPRPVANCFLHFPIV